MNSLPRPMPALAASIVPPCSSTKPLREREADAESAFRAIFAFP